MSSPKLNTSRTIRRFARGLLLVAAVTVLLSGSPAGAQGRERVVCYTAYDEEYFYIAAVVDKPALAGTDRALFGNPTKDDSVAVFLETEDKPTGTRRSAKSVEMAASVAGGVQLYRGSEAIPLKIPPEFLADSTGRRFPIKFAVTRRGEIGGSGGRDTGYTVEMAIPWVELGGPPSVGQRMRFNVVAFSAASGTSPLLSFSPQVKSLDDVQNPSLWIEIVFVDAAVKTVASAPLARVAARVFTSKPLIDGEIAQAEWNTLTAFGFSETPTGSATGFAPTLASARSRAKMALKPAPQPLTSAPRAVVQLAARAPQPVPHLVFALYQLAYQNDPRKAAPLESVRNSGGASLLPSHPLDGDGPWMTYDRVDWHRAQLAQMRQSGIDVVLPAYKADVASRQRFAQRGLMTLASALRSLEAAQADYPVVALYLDTASLSDRSDIPVKLDLRESAGKARLFAAIKDFYLQIPARFRLAVPIDPKHGGGFANVVVLSSAAGVAGIDTSTIEYCRKRFAEEFGADLLILGGSDFKASVMLDGFVNITSGRGFQMDDSGWIKPASIGPGCDETLGHPKAELLRSREDGNVYRDEWRQAINKKADWVFIGGWNDFTSGSEIAPSLEYGVQYLDQTRVYSRAFAGSAQHRAAFIANDLPRVVAAGGELNATIRIVNSGVAVWTPDGNSVVARWERAGSAGGGQKVIMLPYEILPGQATNLELSIAAPTASGDYALVVDGAILDKKGQVTSQFAASGGIALKAAIHVTGPGDAALQPWTATLIRAGIPAALEAGGTYNVPMVLRNDGTSTWPKGGRVTARVWRYTSPINGTGEPEANELQPMADASAALPTDVLPGRQVTVQVPVTFSRSDGTPLTAWTQADNWTYLLRCEVAPDPTAKTGAITDGEPVALVDTDAGVVFTKDLTPTSMPGDRRIPVKLGLKNNGPQTWLKDRMRIGYHWYYLDGVETMWEDETTPLPQDVEPGGSIPEMLVWITAPPNDGTYWLVWDVKVGDVWTSTLPASRPFETMVHRIEVVRGKATMVDLSRYYNLDGITGDSARGDGSFDGTRSLPAELLPPFAAGEDAPNGVWMAGKGSGVDAARKIAFRWGPKGDKEKNIVQCTGQVVQVVPRGSKPEVYKTMYILAAATKDGVSGAFTLTFADETQQFISFPIARWDAPPAAGQDVAFSARRTHTPSGESVDKPVSLYRYVIKIGEAKKLASITLPNNPDIKIVAVTLEK